MILSKNDYYKIADMMSEGCGSIEYEKDGEMLFFDYTIEVEDEDIINDTYAGYQDIVCKTLSVSCVIDNVYCQNDCYDNVTHNFDEDILIEIVQNMM